MTNSERYWQFIRHNFDEGYKLMEKKNADYAGKGDPLANFRGTEFVNISMEKGILIRMLDKLKRAANLLDREAQVKDESIEDTLVDLMNYTNILLTAIQMKSKDGALDNG